MKKYALGQGVRIRGPFRDPETHELLDPPVVKISYRVGSGPVTTKEYDVDDEVVRESEGIYYMDIVGDQVGVWHWRIFSEEDDIAADEGSFQILPSNFA